MELTSKVKANVTKGLAAALLIALPGCVGSCQRGCNDASREWGSETYVITLYANDGSVIKRDSLETYIDLGENGSGIRYLKDGKSIMLNGTYVIEQK